MRNPTQIFITCLALLFCRSVASAAAPQTPLSVDDAELRECQRNLRLIHQAIQAYRRVHQDIPNQLAELVPKFLSEPKYLTCPASRRLGISSLDVAKWKAASLTSYCYEFGLEAIPSIISGGSTRSMREWKRLQMGLVGSEVPMVRCHTHEHGVVSLSFGGRIYEGSNIDWEPLFDDKVDRAALTFARCLRAHALSKTVVVPRRDLQAAPGSVDLSSYYTHVLDEMWPGGSLRPLAGLASASALDTSYDLRGFIQLGALRPGLVGYPTVVSNIVIGLAGRRASLLLGTRHVVAMDTPIADCIFHLANGQTRRLRIQYGRHLLVCLGRAGERNPPLPDGQLAWKAVVGQGEEARLYQTTWDSPSEDEAISSMDFVAQFGESGPFLVAVNVDPIR